MRSASLTSFTSALFGVLLACGGNSEDPDISRSGAAALPAGDTDGALEGPSPGADPGLAPVPAPVPAPIAPPAPTTQPAASDCEAVIDSCLDLAALRVAKYKNNKRAAVSYTFDDGNASSSSIATIFENVGLRATFYIVPSTVESLTGWPLWRELAEKGHEIGNHSMTHTVDMSNFDLSDQVLNYEINASQDVIEQRTGRRAMTFAFPWHAYSSTAFGIALQNHFAVRDVRSNDEGYRWVYFDRDHTASLDEALHQANMTLSDVIGGGGWMVAGGHGIDGDGWSPVTSQFLQNHLQHALGYASRLWIDTYYNVVRYRNCRTQATPTVVNASSSHALIRLDGSIDAPYCTGPLTIIIPTKGAPSEGVSAHAEDGGEIPVMITSEHLLFEMRPGQEVTLRVSPSAN